MLNHVKLVGGKYRSLTRSSSFFKSSLFLSFLPPSLVFAANLYLSFPLCVKKQTKRGEKTSWISETYKGPYIFLSLFFRESLT